MPRVTANKWNDLDIEIEYESFGDPSNPTLLLVSGYTAQMMNYDTEFCRLLADRGLRVIRFDNRDVGMSTHLDGVTFDMKAVMAAGSYPDPSTLPECPYSLSGFSDDAFGLLTALGIEKAHILGCSMGGMIVQTMAIEHPERVLSMTSVMSTTGGKGVGGSTKEAAAALLAPAKTERDEFVAQAVERASIFAPHRHFEVDRARANAENSYDRCFYPEGTTRQLAAIRVSGSREEGLRTLKVPTLVIHGRVDPIIQLSGGERTAELVDGAQLLVLNEMGHDLPRAMWPVLVDAVAAHTARNN